MRAFPALSCLSFTRSPLLRAPLYRNWKDRYFVLSDHLYYYDSKKAYEKDPSDSLGRINLVAYYVSRSDPDANEFCLHAYPKVRLRVLSPRFPTRTPLTTACAPPRPQSLVCRAGSRAEMEEWVNSLMKPLRDLAQVSGGGGGGGGGFDIAAGGSGSPRSKGKKK